jgi:hypothetical protein
VSDIISDAAVAAVAAAADSLNYSPAVQRNMVMKPSENGLKKGGWTWECLPSSSRFTPTLKDFSSSIGKYEWY